MCHPPFLTRICGLPFPETQNNTGCISYFYFCCDQTSDKKTLKKGKFIWAHGLRGCNPPWRETHDGRAFYGRENVCLRPSPLHVLVEQKVESGQEVGPG